MDETSRWIKKSKYIKKTERKNSVFIYYKKIASLIYLWYIIFEINLI